MEESILQTVKEYVGIFPEETHFDSDLIVIINTILAVLTQLGVGPQDGFSISDEQTTWADLNDEECESMAKSYVCIRTKLLFDNSTMNSFTISAFKESADELAWRMEAIANQRK